MLLQEDSPEFLPSADFLLLLSVSFSRIRAFGLCVCKMSKWNSLCETIYIYEYWVLRVFCLCRRTLLHCTKYIQYLYIYLFESAGMASLMPNLLLSHVCIECFVNNIRFSLTQQKTNSKWTTRFSNDINITMFFSFSSFFPFGFPDAASLICQRIPFALRQKKSLRFCFFVFAERPTEWPK